MAKKKKNSNYVTEKTELAKAKKLKDARNKKIKKVSMTVIIAVICVAIAVGAFVGLGFAFGLFDYSPTPTYHAAIELRDYGTLHVELYGNDAPETVDNFIKLANSGYYNGMSFHTMLGSLIYGGSSSKTGNAVNSIKGEFSENGVENKVSHVRGTLSMARGEGFDSAYSQFFIVKENSKELDGSYAAFGRITSGMDIVDRIFEDSTPDENGNIPAEQRAIIMGITTHHAH